MVEAEEEVEAEEVDPMGMETEEMHMVMIWEMVVWHGMISD